MPLKNASTIPIELPEIGTLIAKYLDKYELTRCVRVNKTWHSIFLPFIWETLHFDGLLPSSSDFLEANIKKHCTLIQSINISYLYEHAHMIPTCPNLRTIDVFIFVFLDDTRDEIMNKLTRILAINPTITRFSLDGYISLDILSNLPNLQHLKFAESYSIERPEFLRILEMGVNQLESLSFLCCRINVDPRIACKDILIGLDSIKELHLEKTSFPLPNGGLSLAQQCPNLETFRFIEARSTANSSKEFFQLMTNKTWPKLSKLSYQTLLLTDHEISGVMMTMDQCYQWATRDCEFGPEAFRVLKRHFNVLTDIELRKCYFVESKMLQEILSSCSRLIFFRGPQIMVEDIASGDQWACLSLQVFEAHIGFQSTQDFVVKVRIGDCIPSVIDMLKLDSQQEVSQRVVFEQLSRLRHLQHLSIGVDERIPMTQVYRHGLDLRVGRGLELLSSLRSLETLYFSQTLQLMSENEAYWMLEHWRGLEKVCGMYNFEDPVMDGRVSKVLTSKGILCSYS